MYLPSAVSAFDMIFPGYKWLVLKGDRGELNGRTITIFLMDTKERRDFCYPLAGEEMSEEGMKIWNAAGLEDMAANSRAL